MSRATGQSRCRGRTSVSRTSCTCRVIQPRTQWNAAEHCPLEMVQFGARYVWMNEPDMVDILQRLSRVDSIFGRHRYVSAVIG